MNSSRRSRTLSVFICLLVAAVAGLPEAFPVEGDEKWSFQTLGNVYGSPAVGQDGTIYIGSRDGRVYAVTPNGQEKWSFATGDWVDSSPTLSHDEAVLYVGSWDNKLYALSTASGAKLWEFATGNLIVASPSLDKDGNLFFGSSDGFFYSLDANGEVRWTYPVGYEMDSSPAVSRNGNVYVGAYDGLLYAFSNDGNLLWSFETRETEDPIDRRIVGSPSLDEDGNIYFGAGDGYLYSLNQDGELIWEFAAVEKVDTGVAFTPDGLVVFASRDGFLYAVDENGILAWESYVGDVFYSTPAVDDLGRIYVGSYLGNGVSGISVVDSLGEVKWEYLVLNYIDSSPVIDGSGQLLFGCYDGALYSVETNAGLANTSWARFGADQTNRSQQLSPAFSEISLGFQEWLQVNGISGYAADPCGDEDGDGWELVLEYVLGMDPRTSEAGGSQVVVDASGSGDVVAFQLVRVKGDAAVAYEVQYSFDLETWQALDSAGLSVGPQVLDADAFGDGKYETVQYVLEAGSQGSVFVRVRANCD